MRNAEQGVSGAGCLLLRCDWLVLRVVVRLRCRLLNLKLLLKQGLPVVALEEDLGVVAAGATFAELLVPV